MTSKPDALTRLSEALSLYHVHIYPCPKGMRLGLLPEPGAICTCGIDQAVDTIVKTHSSLATALESACAETIALRAKIERLNADLKLPR